MNKLLGILLFLILGMFIYFSWYSGKKDFTIALLKMSLTECGAALQKANTNISDLDRHIPIKNDYTYVEGMDAHGNPSYLDHRVIADCNIYPGEN